MNKYIENILFTLYKNAGTIIIVCFGLIMFIYFSYDLRRDNRTKVKYKEGCEFVAVAPFMIQHSTNCTNHQK